MIIECCSQERSYSTFYGLIGERFCKLNRVWYDCFEQAFGNYYTTIHRYETNRLRNIARFFGHLIATDSISWTAMECIKLTEDDTTSSSRIFVKIMMNEVTEALGLKTLVERFKDDEIKRACSGMFPMDNPKDTRFAINYFTSIGLGAVTEEMREHLKNAPRIIMEQRRALLEAESSSSDSSDSDSDPSDSSDDSSDSDSSVSASDSDASEDSRRSPRRRRSVTPPRRDRDRSRDSRTPPRRERDKRRSPTPPPARYRERDEDRRRDGGRYDDKLKSRYDSPPRRRDYTPERRDRDRDHDYGRARPRSPTPPPPSRSRYDRDRRSRSRSLPRREADREGRDARDAYDRNGYDRRRYDGEREKGRDERDVRDRRRSVSRERYGRDLRR